MAYIPQTNIFQIFEETPVTQGVERLPVIIGPKYILHRDIPVGVYEGTEYNFQLPEKQSGENIDINDVIIEFKNARLQYFYDQVGDGKEAHVDSNYINAVRCERIISDGFGYTRDADIPLNVEKGDYVKITGIVGGQSYSVEGTILDLLREIIPSQVKDAETASGNWETSAYSATISQISGADTGITSTVDGTNYDGYAAGRISETYIIEVITASTNGDPTTALLRYASADGQDVGTIVPSQWGEATEIGTRGLKVTFDCGGSSSSGSTVDFVIGQQWKVEVTQSYVQVSATSGGTYTGPNNVTYICEVIQGGHYSDDTKPAIRVYTDDGSDSSNLVIVPDADTFVNIGHYGVQIKFDGDGLVKGDKFTIQVVAESLGAYKGFFLNTTIPEEIRNNDPDLDIVYYKVKDKLVPKHSDIYGAVANYTLNGDQITLKDNIQLYLSDGNKYPVVFGEIYVTYKGLDTAIANTVLRIPAGQYDSGVLGENDFENPLGKAVALAQANSSVEILAVPVQSNDLAGYNAAINVLWKEKRAYAISVLSQDEEIINAIISYVNAASTADKQKWAITYICPEQERVKRILYNDTTPYKATITDDPMLPGTQYRYLYTEDDVKFTKNVRAGDKIRINYYVDAQGNESYDEYTVDVVLNDHALRLLESIPTPITTPIKFEVYRYLSESEFAAEVGTKSSSYGNMLVRRVWPPKVYLNTEDEKPGYYLTAMLAALRCSSAPHQPLSNVEIYGISDISDEYLFGEYLNDVVGAGTFVINKDINRFYIVRQVTTDNSSLNKFEDSIITNIHDISYAISEEYRNKMGKSNISPAYLNQLEIQLSGVLQTIKDTVYPTDLGSRILSYNIKSLYQHAVLKDKIVAEIQLELPAPFNFFDIYLIL